MNQTEVFHGITCCVAHLVLKQSYELLAADCEFFYSQLIARQKNIKVDF